jgi:Helix-turn-helix domain
MDDAPMLLTDKGKPDTTARHVLQILAERADAKGRDAFPSELDIEFRSGFDRRTIQRALRRLESAELIVAEGSRYGCTNYSLALWRKRPKGDREKLREAYELARSAAAERQRRSRAKRQAGAPASGGEADQEGGVTHSTPARHAFKVRDVTHLTPARHALNAALTVKEPSVEPPRTIAPRLLPDCVFPSEQTAAPSSLRSDGLPREDQVDHVPPEETQPVVRTATIPARGRASAGVRDVGEIGQAKRHHMQSCGYCQQGPSLCDAGASLLAEWALAGPGWPQAPDAPF